MKKLIKGIVDFRQKLRPEYREKFAKLALGQSPDTLFIACSDSRVAANVFASTDPGDLFVIRNVGNLIPPGLNDGHSSADESEAAALEFALQNLHVTDIVVCGHSDCGAMHALLMGRENVKTPNLKGWLRHGEASLSRLSEDKDVENPYNRLAQLNVLQQLEHLRSYELVRRKLSEGKLRLHGWWFDLASVQVHAFEEAEGKFVPIDEKEAEKILSRLSH